MRAAVTIVLLLILNISQDLKAHAHQPADTHGHAELAGAHVDHAYAHSHVMDAGSASIEHWLAADDVQVDALFQLDPTRYSGILAGLLWLVVALVFSTRSGFFLPIRRPQATLHSRPSICLRPAPQGPPKFASL